MKKITITQLGILTTIVLVTIIGATLYYQKSKKQNPQEQATSLKQLLEVTIPRVCTFNSTQSDAQSSGTVFVSNGMLRGDFISTINNQTVTSHLIVKDATSYVWTDDLQQGVKISMEKSNDANGDNAPINLNEKMTYDCQDWAREEKVFVLPETIEFQDFSTIMESLNNSAIDTKTSPTTDACDSCNQVPENARQQCRKTLGCQ
ncbi:MAG: hypothetical protein RIQ54_633 [Candidatus Parcubacteria bacterium]|jgi:hypothetical protein